MRYWLFLASLIFALQANAETDSSDTDNYFPQQLSAKDLLIACSSSSLTNLGRERQKYCYGFISGVEEAVRLLEKESPKVIHKICTSPGLTSRDLAKTYIRYAAKKDAHLTKPAALVVVESLAFGYPCKDNE